MTSSWLGLVIGACLVVLQRGIRAQFIFSNCGLSDLSSRIVNGRDAPLGSAPFMAYVMKNNVYHCGGSIVNHRYILTAAHCLDVVGLSVRLGEHNDLTNPDCDGMVCIPPHEHFGIEVVAHHKLYDKVSQANDIALVRLNRDIIFDVHIQPICLNLHPSTAPSVTNYTAYGWGYIHSYDKERAHVLQTTDLRLFYNQGCESQFRTLTNNQICAGSEITDTCRGDSGSPLVTMITTNDGQERSVQLGIVSYGNRRCTGAGAYTYVPNYGAWIMDKMRIMDQEYGRPRTRNVQNWNWQNNNNMPQQRG